jgi:hypothetical protein
MSSFCYAKINKIPKTTGSATGKNDPAIQADSAPGEEQQ